MVRKLFFGTIISLILLTNCFFSTTNKIKVSSNEFSISTDNETNLKTYLPIVNKSVAKFFGIYVKGYLNRSNIEVKIPPLDQQAGKKHSVVGWFIDLEDDAFTKPVRYLPGNNLFVQLEELWKKGYISFINLSSRDATALEIANGQRDDEIEFAADFYKQWLDLGENRRAFIAPLQEMNGYWVTYGKDPQNYIKAYKRIISIFESKGVNRNQVWWVFAPNGWSEPGYEFEKFYPGDDAVDFVAFSSYNYGFCPGTVETSAWWGDHFQIFEPYIERMEKLAPSKKIIIRETATSAYYDWNLANPNIKNKWLIDSYSYLANRNSIVGILYFNLDNFDGRNCDFSIENYEGYRIGIMNNPYQYLNTIQIAELAR